MSVWDICIRRPVFTAMLASAPVVLGLASYLRLGLELFPNVDVPMVTVTTTLRGASVEEMETAVTKPIEDAGNTVSSIDELRSETREGSSQVVVAFKLDKNGDVAAQEVDFKVRTILTQLPVGTDPPKHPGSGRDRRAGFRPERRPEQIREGVSSTINVLVGGQPVSKYKERDEQYDVWLRADREAIARMGVPAAKGPRRGGPAGRRCPCCSPCW